MRITITGTPGTGKTTLSNLLSEKLKIPVYHLSELIREKGLYSGYDEKRGSYVADVEKLRWFFSGKENFIAEGLVAHFIPSDVLIVLRASPEVVRRRLEERGYPREKVEENVEAERFDVCASEALKLGNFKRVIQIDTTKRKPEDVLRLALEGISGRDLFEDVDWLEVP